MPTKAQILTNHHNTQNLCVLCVLRGEKDRAISYNKNMQNKPNFPNAKINIITVPIKAYMENDAFAPRKNKPNSNPISNSGLGINQL